MLTNVGATVATVANIGDMENRGVEVELGYKKSWSDFSLSINGNFAYNQNKVLSLETGRLYEDGVGFQSMGPIQRIVPGEAYNSFYGFQTLGVFQNQSKINSYVNANG